MVSHCAKLKDNYRDKDQVKGALHGLHGQLSYNPSQTDRCRDLNFGMEVKWKDI